ncbi:hypothetical protein EYD00_18955 [Agrobacterium sp. 33MFTa1.1]|uniref:N-6 DNA methylase n=1 Tax=Agrobacterium sp. 33MFTa1.1 TaxID=1279031 RepID=UPI0005524016|nr:N-6 DNA methylase [Agrobacterium sp. 33MFTa1.1]QBJ15521.1 hypothetical protein EYD00_18955 [Agrobacterium sp. 33MFTa1.1]
MSSTADQRTPLESIRELTVELNPAGRIVDYLDNTISRADGPEERVRQYYAKVLCEEYGYPKARMRFEVPINIGSDVKFADIVVFQTEAAATSKSQGQIAIVVETKAPTKTIGHGQLASYISASSASGGVWFNGHDIAYFRQVVAPEAQLAPWTNIPRFGQTWDTVGHYKKSDLRPPRELKTVFQRCHNIIYRAGSDSEDIALDMLRIILAKYRDEQNEGEICEFRCSPEEFATPEGIHTAAGRVHELFAQVVADHSDVFPPYEKISLRDEHIASVVNELQPFQFLADDETEQVYDVIGTAFEIYVSSHLKGARGQYFTNRLFINMMVDMIDPGERDRIYDPTCGSGGFLIAALRHVRRKILSSNRAATARSRALRTVSEKLYGSDIAPRLVRVAKTNMILNGDGHGGIVHLNALRKPEDPLPLGFPLQDGLEKDLLPTIILSNPPFGASHELRERNRDVLTNFELGHVWTTSKDGWLKKTDSLNDSDGVPPEILFLEQCIKLLAPGGKLGIVLARGVLDNRDALAARQYVLRHTRILGVVNCHPNTFAPFNGTKASILFLEKKKSEGFARNEDYPVFMAASQKVGQDSMGREIYKTNDAGAFVVENGAYVLDHDLDRIAEAWRSFRSGRPLEYEAAWITSLSKITSAVEMRMNPTRFAPQAESAITKVLELAGTEDWTVERLGDFAQVFNGPRFKRPFAEDSVTSGPGIIRMYTPKAFFEERGESAKYLDVNRATSIQRRALDVLRLQRDWILIVDSGTAGKLLGRVGMTSGVHDGSIGNNNLIRVVIDDPVRRGYVYQFLRSELGQALLLRNVYGTNQDHIEPDDVKDIPIPIPRDNDRFSSINAKVKRITWMRERAASLDAQANDELASIFSAALEQTEEPN